MKTNRIGIDRMLFWAYHGVYENERKQGGQFEVNILIETDYTKASLTDNLTDTIDYTQIYNIINEEMGIPSNLLEHVAKRITDRLIFSFPQITSGTIKIAKLNPPILGNIGSVWIENKF